MASSCPSHSLMSSAGHRLSFLPHTLTHLFHLIPCDNLYTGYQQVQARVGSTSNLPQTLDPSPRHFIAQMSQWLCVPGRFLPRESETGRCPPEATAGSRYSFCSHHLGPKGSLPQGNCPHPKLPLQTTTPNLQSPTNIPGLGSWVPIQVSESGQSASGLSFILSLQRSQGTQDSESLSS